MAVLSQTICPIHSLCSQFLTQPVNMPPVVLVKNLPQTVSCMGQRMLFPLVSISHISHHILESSHTDVIQVPLVYSHL